MKKIFLMLGLIAVATVSCKDDDEGGEIITVEEVTIDQGPAVFVQIGTTDALPQLSATAKPDNATNKTMDWRSDKPGIIAVDQNTGQLSFGTEEITAPTKVSIIVRSVNEKSATTTVYVTPAAPSGYQVLDTVGYLTNSFYMLDRNVGASAVGESGNYYQWGRNAIVAAEGDANVNGNFDYDVAWSTANANWAEGVCPEGWRLPTKADLDIIANLTLPYFENLFWEGMGEVGPYTEEEAAAALSYWNMMKMAESGMFNVADVMIDNPDYDENSPASETNPEKISGDNQITPDEVSMYMTGAPVIWSSELTGEFSENTLYMPTAYNFANNFQPTVEKNRTVMNAMPVRCVMDIQ